MKLQKREPSGREKNEESIKLLEQLREKLYLNDVSAARRAAFVLSWKQEDGLDILKEALLINSPRTTKIAAVYGLRNMHGRMKKMALSVLEQGLKSHSTDIRNACNHALSLTKQNTPQKYRSKKPLKAKRFEIKEVRRKNKPRGRVRTRRTY